jgi:mitochondrial import inner membrane translocase subunit TIM22
MAEGTAGSNHVKFTPQEIDSIAKYFVGNTYRYREHVVIPRTVGPIQIKSDQEKQVEAIFESCAFKSVLATVAGKLNLLEM